MPEIGGAPLVFGIPFCLCTAWYSTFVAAVWLLICLASSFWPAAKRDMRPVTATKLMGETPVPKLRHPQKKCPSNTVRRA